MDRASKTTTSRIQWTQVLVEILLQESVCSSHEEATAIVESIVEDNDEEYKDKDSFVLVHVKGDGLSLEEEDPETVLHEEMVVLTIPLLVDYVGVTEEVARSICTKHQTRLLSRLHATTTTPDMMSTGSNNDCEDKEDDVSDSTEDELDQELEYDDDDDDDDDDSNEEEIAEGDCELCERNGLKLTKHHLIPKSTWKKLQPKLKNAWDNRDGENQDRVHKLLEGTTLFEFLPVLLAQEKKERRKQKSRLKQQQQQQQQQPQNVPKGQSLLSPKEIVRGNGIALSTVRNALGCHTCIVCRQCHTVVHDAHDNLTLALQYSTREALLEDVRIAKFCAWANKQKPSRGNQKGAVHKR